jgi:hypothetical protein
MHSCADCCIVDYIGYIPYLIYIGNTHMSKKVKTAKAAVATEPVVQTAVTAAPQQMYTIVAPKRPLGTDTKNGKAGTAGTHAALAKAATDNGGKLTWAQIQAVVDEQGDKAFARYALNRLKVIVPVAAQQPAV